MPKNVPRHFLSTLDHSIDEISALVERALALKRGEEDAAGRLPGRVLATIFFNPSVRTRVSCEAAMARLGGHAIALHPGRDTWNFEHREGIVMDGATQEHVSELAPVLCSMCDAVGIRKSDLVTTGLDRAQVTRSWEEIRDDAFLRAFARHATRPVLNLESNAGHPLQGLADMATIKEKLGEPRGRKYVLTWAYHPKPLPVATPHSQFLAACDLGMDVTILRPDGYDLAPDVVAAGTERARRVGGDVRVTSEQETAFRGAEVVCAKSWGSLDHYGRFDEEARLKETLRERWILDEAKMALTRDAWFLHCLPVRRGVVVTDGVIDAPRSAVREEAANRYWTVLALLLDRLGG